MNYPLSPPASQRIGSGQSLHLHMNAGDRLLIISGQARIEQTLWIAERMVMQHISLSAEQAHICQQAGWIRLLGLSAVDFFLTESLHDGKTGWRALLRRIAPISMRSTKTSAQ